MAKMNKSAAFCTVLMAFGFASQASALSMECKAGVMRASSGGLIPVEQEIKLTATVLQSERDLDLKKCSDTSISGMTVSLCAIEDSEAKGVFHAEMAIFVSQGEEFTRGKNMLALSKNGGDLVNLISSSALTPTFEQKMSAADITFPEYTGGDSLMIDDAIANGFKKGVISTNDIVSIALTSCQLK